MNMKQSCKALICAIEGELDGRHCTEEQAAAILDHALPSLTEALARVEAELKATDQKLLAKTGAHEFLKYGVNNLVKERDTAQAQLAEAVGLLKHVKDWFGWGDLPESLGKLDTFLARHAQAEQQEAQGAQAGGECKRPPEGWKCSRVADHKGPCAASKADPLSAEMSALELMQTWTGEDWSEMAESFPALAEQIEGARRAALATQPAAVSDLLAVIHRDGGHYQDQHGLDKAAREAEAIVQAERANQPAAGEPVAWIIESPEGCSPCKSINHLKHMAERYAAVGWSVTPLYAAPPAAAHGDEAVRFERADVVAVLRDDLLAMSGDVDPSTGRSEMECLLASWLKGHDIPVFRKTLYAMRAQGDGD